MAQVLQRVAPSGEVYCVEYGESGEIIGVAGPLKMSEARAWYPHLPANEPLDAYDYGNERVEWARSQSWGYPLTVEQLGYGAASGAWVQ